ncbi:endolytic transglycosylase MltG [Peptostreptococcus canis]|uniref:Endolytic murein transglycosylase n=1 Tax=Peptostreptococcus canis TaxID=1159213 RepID=A0ABR6TM54_9FIRM|nr:endolytic transglycosylase MltG [Peptostreptococcus canis]
MKLVKKNNFGKKGKKRKRIVVYRFLIIIFLIFSILAAGGNIYFKIASGAVDSSNKQNIVVDIPDGSTVPEIARILKKNKLIRNERVFISNAKNTDKSNLMKAGKYKLSQSMSNDDIIHKMIDGMVYQDGIKITIPEGSLSTDIVNKLVNKGLGNRQVFVKLFREPKAFSKEYKFLDNSRIKTLEGFLYPETYYFKKGSTEKQIFSKMLKEFEKNYNKNVKAYVDKQKYDFYDTVIMASIVEKETVQDVDRDIVAGVFYNRLDKKMKLQSDAVLQYGLPERKSRVRYKDLKVDTVYNLYIHDGLPPTPIASPGIKSLVAAANPKRTNYLYFITGTDNKNYYSETYEEHMKYAKKYHKELDALEAKDKEKEKKASESKNN